MLDGVKYEIPIEVIEAFDNWNDEPLKQSKSIDKLVVEAIMYSLLASNEIANGLVSDEKREFIHHVLEIRIGDDAERVSKVNGYIEEVCNSNNM